MTRTVPWIIAAVLLVAFGASFSELQRMRKRFGEVTRYQDSHHGYYRQFIVRSQLADAKDPIVVIGDSITERAAFPETIDGRQVINAGVGGAGAGDFEWIAAALIEHRPSFVVIALGTNDTAERLRTAYPVLLARLKTLSPHLLAVGVTPQDGADLKNAQIKAAAEREGVRFVDIPLPDGSRLPDQIHLSEAGYRKWTPALVAAIAAFVS